MKPATSAAEGRALLAGRGDSLFSPELPTPLRSPPPGSGPAGGGCGGRSSTAPQLCSKGKGRQARSHHLAEGSGWGHLPQPPLQPPMVLTWTVPAGQGRKLRPRETLPGPVHPRGRGPHHRPSGEPSCWVDPQTSGHSPRRAPSSPGPLVEPTLPLEKPVKVTEAGTGHEVPFQPKLACMPGRGGGGWGGMLSGCFGKNIKPSRMGSACVGSG